MAAVVVVDTNDCSKMMDRHYPMKAAAVVADTHDCSKMMDRHYNPI